MRQSDPQQCGSARRQRHLAGKLKATSTGSSRRRTRWRGRDGRRISGSYGRAVGERGFAPIPRPHISHIRRQLCKSNGRRVVFIDTIHVLEEHSPQHPLKTGRIIALNCSNTKVAGLTRPKVENPIHTADGISRIIYRETQLRMIQSAY